MKRREFIKSGAIAMGAIGLSACQRPQEHQSITINKGKKTTLKLSTSWPAHFPIMGTGVDAFAARCKELSGGTLEIKVYPKDILVPALAVFDTTSNAQIDAFHSGVYYWKGKNAAFSIFGGMPFGLTSEEMITWMQWGGGMDCGVKCMLNLISTLLLEGQPDHKWEDGLKKKSFHSKTSKGLRCVFQG